MADVDTQLLRVEPCSDQVARRAVPGLMGRKGREERRSAGLLPMLARFGDRPLVRGLPRRQRSRADRATNERQLRGPAEHEVVAVTTGAELERRELTTNVAGERHAASSGAGLHLDLAFDVIPAALDTHDARLEVDLAQRSARSSPMRRPAYSAVAHSGRSLSGSAASSAAARSGLSMRSGARGSPAARGHARIDGDLVAM